MSRNKHEAQKMREDLKADKAAGLSNKQLAEKYSISPAMVSHYFKQERKAARENQTSAECAK